MGSDVPQLQYLLPKFNDNYTMFMKTLQNSCAFDTSDIAKFRLKVIEFGKKHGVIAAVDAFGVKRSTYFLWKKKFLVSQGRLTSLVPHSTRPKRIRHMQVNPHILEFIKHIRQQYGRVGKQKIQVLLTTYCTNLGITPIQATTIGKIIKRHRYYFEGRKTYKRKHLGVPRTRKAPREKTPGYIEMDSVIVRIVDQTHVFITAIDVVTKFALCLYAGSTKSKKAKELLELFISQYHFTLRTVQTDNGSEFLGAFDNYCHKIGLEHVFTYPRSPRINGGVERFNRTIQEEFIDRTDSFFSGPANVTSHLINYLSWYNGMRPHQSLGMKTPSQYIQQLESNM